MNTAAIARARAGGRERDKTGWGLAVLGLAGLGLSGIAILIELTDSEPRAQLWVGAAAGLCFLLAVPLVRGREDHVLLWRARLLVGAGVAVVLAVIGLRQASEQSEPRILLLLAPALLLFVTAAVAVREATRSARRVRASQLRSRILGEENERRRWAQELHDQTLQDLAAIEVRLGVLVRGRDPERLVAGLQDVRAMVREEIRTLRHLITQMRPLALDTLGLVPALQDLARKAEDASDLPVRVELGEFPADLDPEVQLTMFRIVQEAVTNAVRHSACSQISISARTIGPLVEVMVHDDGIGLPEQGEAFHGTGFGTSGMVDRAEAIGGRISWVLPSEGGTSVVLAIPMDVGADEH